MLDPFCILPAEKWREMVGVFVKNGLASALMLDAAPDEHARRLIKDTTVVVETGGAAELAALRSKFSSGSIEEFIKNLLFVVSSNALTDLEAIPERVKTYIVQHTAPEYALIATKIAKSEPCSRLCSVSSLPVREKICKRMSFYIIIGLECLRVFNEVRERPEGCAGCYSAAALYMAVAKMFEAPKEDNICCMLCQHVCLESIAEWTSSERARAGAHRLAHALRSFKKIAKPISDASPMYTMPAWTDAKGDREVARRNALLEASIGWANSMENRMSSFAGAKDAFRINEAGFENMLDAFQQKGTTPLFPVFVESLLTRTSTPDDREKQNNWLKKHIFNAVAKKKPIKAMPLISERYLFLMEKMFVEPYLKRKTMHDSTVQLRALKYLLFPKNIQYISSDGLRKIWDLLISNQRLWEAHVELAKYIISKFSTLATTKDEGNTVPSILLWKVLLSEYTRLKKTLCTCSSEQCDYCVLMRTKSPTPLVDDRVAIEDFGTIEAYAVYSIEEALNKDAEFLISSDPPFHNLELLSHRQVESRWRNLPFFDQADRHAIVIRKHSNVKIRVYMIHYIVMFLLDADVPSEAALEIFESLTAPTDTAVPRMPLDSYAEPNPGTVLFYEWMNKYSSDMERDSNMDSFMAKDYAMAKAQTDLYVGKNMSFSNLRILKPIYAITAAIIADMMKNRRHCIVYTTPMERINMNDVIAYSFALGNCRVGRALRLGAACEMPVFMTDKTCYTAREVEVCRINPVYTMPQLLKTHGIVDPNMQMLPIMICFYNNQFQSNIEVVQRIINRNSSPMSRRLKFMDPKLLAKSMSNDPLPHAFCAELGF